MPISREITLIEKILCCLDSQCKNILITKDLMNVFVLDKQNFNILKVKSWVEFKISMSNLNKEAYKDFVYELEAQKEKRLKSLVKTFVT